MVLARSLTALLVLLALLPLLAGPLDARGDRDGQDAEDARQGEDNLDELLRRFGPEMEGLKERIARAIDRGVTWLVAQQQGDGHWQCYDGGQMGYPLGGTALCALAVKKSMVGLYEGDERDLTREIRKLEREERRERISPEDVARLAHLREHGEAEIEQREQYQRVVDRALDWIRNRYDRIKGQGMMMLPGGGQAPPFRVYDLGVVLMLLEAYFSEKQETDEGYAVVVNQRAIPRGDLDWIREMVRNLEQVVTTPTQNGQTFDGRGWRYPGPAQDGATVDNSNSQYAVLGLKAASRMGVHVDNANMWRQLAEYFMGIQEPDGPVVPRRPAAIDANTGEYFHPGTYSDPQPDDKARGWGYLPILDPHHPVSGAMTTAALAGLITAQSELYEANVLPRDERLKEQIERSIADGMAWLGLNFSVSTNPVARRGMRIGWHYYYLYGLERAGVLAQTEFFGEHAWYPLGARYLCDNQAADGHWNSNSNPQQPGAGAQGPVLADTAFAILFLKRATTPVNVPPIVRPEITGRD